MKFNKKVNFGEEEEFDVEISEEEVGDFDLGEDRITALYGDVNTKNAKNLIASILYLGKPYIKNEVEYYQPFDMFINTPGGNAADMFAIYDIMRQTKKNTEIHTVGIGKVMSAGVLLLAAGTTGKRKIGKNCRIMIHPVQSDFCGTIKNVSNNLQEVDILQKLYAKGLCDETNMKQKDFKRIFDKGLNYYLGAEEALALGIADEII